MQEIRIKIVDDQVTAALDRLDAGLTDRTPLMRSIAGDLKAGVQRNFREQRAPDGTPWKKLSKVTTQQRVFPADAGMNRTG